MTPPDPQSQPRRTGRYAKPIVLVALAAMAMGLPTLRGGFVGGDDHRLVLDHVLVNRPSIEHAFQLFTIVHRDLYQPLPLLTFSAEMAIAQGLDLFRSGSQGGAWLFHLTNVLLHALVAVAVFGTVGMLQSRVRARKHSVSQLPGQLGSPVRDEMKIAQHFNAGSPAGASKQRAVGTTEWHHLGIPTFAALLFAIHPLNVEVVAWVNGRMMLLSTLFALCGILAFSRWLDRGRWFDAALVLLCMVLSALSKVRVGLPLLLLLVALMRSDWRRLRFWPVWIAAGALTALFAWINIGATSQADLFAEAAEHLQGPRSVRVLLALDNYFTHVVWPAGLTSYYPTPPTVAWTDSQTLRAVLVVGLAFAMLALAAWRIPAACWGTAWFFIAIADTLPFVPARNVLAADRYMYLPLVGLFWTIAAILLFGHSAVLPLPLRERAGVRVQPFGAGNQRTAVTFAAFLLVPTLIGTSWYTARWYDTPQLKTQRVARVFPEVPRVWERFGWTLYSDGLYDKAIELAQREFVHDIPAVQSGAYQLIGMSRFKQGNVEEGLTALQKAVEIDPKNDLARFRLGMVYEDLGRYADALPLFEACVRSASSHNPTLHRLAHVYRELGRPADARAMYELELKNNPYEFPAALALAEMDFRESTPESLRSAEGRLRALLDWMPENVTARVNLAHLYDTIGNASEAARHYHIAIDYGFEQIEQAAFAHDFFEKHGDLSALANVWRAFLNKNPEDSNGLGFLAWSYLLAGQADHARSQIARLGPAARTNTMAQATVIMLALEDGRDDVVRSLARPLSATDDSAARQRLLKALERFDARRPGLAWTYFLTASLLQAEGQLDAARAFLDLFSTTCQGPDCAEAERFLKSKIP